eukprot:scaffold52223_cov30-Tisochrysis_lutea.AAC.1
MAPPSLLLASAALSFSPFPLSPAGRIARGAVRLSATDFGLAPGQKYGPTAPAHTVSKPWTNLETQEGVQLVKAASNDLRSPLIEDMGEKSFQGKRDILVVLWQGGWAGG